MNEEGSCTNGKTPTRPIYQLLMLRIGRRGKKKTPTTGYLVDVPSVHDSKRVHLQGSRDDERHPPTIVSAGLCCSSFESSQGRVVRLATNVMTKQRNLERLYWIYTYLMEDECVEVMQNTMLTKLTADSTQSTRNKPADSTNFARIVDLIQVLGECSFL